MWFGLRRNDGVQLHAPSGAGITHADIAAPSLREIFSDVQFQRWQMSQHFHGPSDSGPYDRAIVRLHLAGVQEQPHRNGIVALLLGGKIEFAFAPRLQRILHVGHLGDHPLAERINDLPIEEVDRLTEDLLHARGGSLRCAGIGGVQRVVVLHIRDEENRAARLRSSRGGGAGHRS